ncbi:hypothetical protein BDV25DRAFT_135640 [Aspergillus avenaceus]|uniref:Uncharacterized protein n=1 Tax=Aspergillus avenaceus TaxID=36643 RepID=A0A5N6U9B2_ASPAV|nr:hypothetical protein BDV25DRAFT_135640 [Aspergillus avenaceus]
MDVSQDQNFFETDQPAAQSQQGSPSFHYHLAPLPRSICAFKACRSCERRHGVLEERTWLSLNEICSDPNILPPKSWELLRRPISSARVLRNIGQHCKDTNRQVQSFGDRSEQRLDTGRIRLYSRTNITSTNLHELVEKSLAITGS